MRTFEMLMGPGKSITTKTSKNVCAYSVSEKRPYDFWGPCHKEWWGKLYTVDSAL